MSQPATPELPPTECCDGSGVSDATAGLPCENLTCPAARILLQHLADARLSVIDEQRERANRADADAERYRALLGDPLDIEGWTGVTRAEAIRQCDDQARWSKQDRDHVGRVERSNDELRRELQMATEQNRKLRALTDEYDPRSLADLPDGATSWRTHAAGLAARLQARDALYDTVRVELAGARLRLADEVATTAGLRDELDTALRAVQLDGSDLDAGVAAMVAAFARLGDDTTIVDARRPLLAAALAAMGLPVAEQARHNAQAVDA